MLKFGRTFSDCSFTERSANFKKMTKTDLVNHKRYLERVKASLDKDLATVNVLIRLEFEKHLDYVAELYEKASKNKYKK